MSDREAQAKLGEMFRLLAHAADTGMNRLAVGLFQRLDCDGPNLEADDALRALGLLRGGEGDSPRVYGPEARTGREMFVEGIFFPPILSGADAFGAWRWAKVKRFQGNPPKCEGKRAGYRGCTAGSWLTVYLPRELDADRPSPFYLCGTAAKLYLKDHPEAAVIDGYWRIVDFDPATGAELKEGGR